LKRIKNVFIIVGSIIGGLTLGLVMGALYLIDDHKKTLNRIKTDKGRQTRIDNLIKNKNGKSRKSIEGNQWRGSGEREDDSGVEGEAGSVRGETGEGEAGSEGAGEEEGGSSPLDKDAEKEAKSD